MREGSIDLRQRLLVGFWFVTLVGMMAGLSDDLRLLSSLHHWHLQMKRESQRLDREIAVLQNKLRYLYTPEGVQSVRRTQFLTDRGRLLVFEDGLPPIGVVELLPGGFEEWNASGKVNLRERNRWLVRVSRYWQRLKAERYR